LNPNITLFFLYDLPLWVKITKYEKGALNGKNLSCHRNDSSFLPSHFEVLKPFFSDSASQSEYENVVLNFCITILELKKNLVLARIEKLVSSLKKASNVFP
jgi:hypothetical protein